MPMTRRAAVGRGGVAGAAWAAALCLASWAAVGALGIDAVSTGYLREFARFFGSLEGTPYFATAGFIAGAIVGLLGRVAEAPPPWVRRIPLWFSFFPAAAVGFATVMWLAGIFGAGLADLPGALLTLPRTVLGVLAVGLPWLSPGLALPLLAAAPGVSRRGARLAG